jgi:hypothetical protein
MLEQYLGLRTPGPSSNRLEWMSVRGTLLIERGPVESDEIATLADSERISLEAPFPT